MNFFVSNICWLTSNFIQLFIWTAFPHVSFYGEYLPIFFSNFTVSFYVILIYFKDISIGWKDDAAFFPLIPRQFI